MCNIKQHKLKFHPNEKEVIIIYGFHTTIEVRAFPPRSIKANLYTKLI
jgi:hypothetical protein